VAIDADSAPAASGTRSQRPVGLEGTSRVPLVPLRRHDRVALGVFDAAAHSLQRHGRTVIVGSATLLLPLVALNLFGTIVAFEQYSSLDSLSASPAAVLFGVDAASGVETLVAYLSIVTTSLIAAIVGGFTSFVVLDDHFGRDPAGHSPLRRTLRASPRLVGGWLVGHCWMVLVALIAVNVSSSALGGLMIPGSAVLVFVVAFTVVVSPTIVAERLRPLAGVRRAVRLARSRFSSAFGLVILTVVFGGGLQAGISALPRLAASTGLIGYGSFGWLVEGIAAQIAVLIVVPLVAMTSVHLYLQLRVHSEGLDLVIAADRAFGPVVR
jgi:hypothetical protein